MQMYVIRFSPSGWSVCRWSTCRPSSAPIRPARLQA